MKKPSKQFSKEERKGLYGLYVKLIGASKKNFESFCAKVLKNKNSLKFNSISGGYYLTNPEKFTP